MGSIQGINHIAFVIKDLDASIKSTVEILGGELIVKFESSLIFVPFPILKYWHA